MFFRWLDSVRKEFRIAMTGSLLLTCMGLAQGLWQVPIPRWCYIIVIVAFLTWAFYQAWLKEHRLRLDALSEIDKQLHADKRDWVAEWKGLADRFQATSQYVRADWQHGGMGVANGEVIETWHLCGAASTPERKTCEALCAFAGQLLMHSPQMSVHLTSNTLKQKGAIERWLTFLKETHNAMSMNSGYGIVQGSENEDKIILLGTIEKVATVSAMACIACATAEV